MLLQNDRRERLKFLDQAANLASPALAGAAEEQNMHIHRHQDGPNLFVQIRQMHWFGPDGVQGCENEEKTFIH